MIHFSRKPTLPVARSGIAVALLVCLLATPASADSTGLVIQIQPAGSVVELRGNQSTVTASPNQIPRPQPGWYEIRASYPGFETWKDRVFIDPSTPEMLSAVLSPKTRAKAGLRALAFPGWGHYYSGRQTRGIFMTVVALGAAGGYLYLDNRYDRKLSDYEALQRDFENAESVAEQRRLKPLVEDARRTAYDAESDRRNWGWAAVGFYAYQVLDAVLFFPDHPAVSMKGVKFGLQPAAQAPVLLGATYEF